MFKNPLKYQTGGQMTQDQQQMLAAFIQWLPQRVPEFQGMQPEAIVQALDGMSKTPEGQKQVQAYMEAFQQEINGEQPSATFKKGGKINAFVCKHAKGGYVAGCNCKENGGEIEIDKNGKRISRYSDRNTWGKATSQGDTTINGSYSDHSQEMKITPKGTIYREWNNGDMFPSVSVANQTYFDNHPLIRFFSRNFGIGPKLVKGNEEVVTNMNAAKDAHQNAWIPSNQEGGELTRKEALRLGRENKGYNRSQSRFAYQNAKNTLRNNSNLRGKELRQTARQWVAGQNEQPQSRVLSAPISYGESLPVAQQMNYPTKHNESLSNLSFNDAFARARRAGAQTFWWPRGRYKLYNTELGTSGNQAGDINNSAKIVAIPNLPVIDTNFNIPDIVVDENSIPQVTLNLADTTPVVNISGIPEPIVQSNLKSTTESVSKPNNSDYFVEEYLRTHFPNGARRNFIARNIYGQQRNLINETSPLFIGPPRPGTVQSHKIGGKVEKAQNGTPAVYGTFEALKSDEYKKGLPVSGRGQNRGGGGDITDYGELLTDENGLQYRDVRQTDWNSARGTLNQNFSREYVPNNRYKRLTKQGWTPTEYTQEQRDSLAAAFNKNFGDLGRIAQDDRGYDYWEVDDNVINRYYPWFNRNNE